MYKVLAIFTSVIMVIGSLFFTGCGEKEKKSKPQAKAKVEKQIERASYTAAKAIPQSQSVDSILASSQTVSTQRLHMQARNVLAQTQILRQQSDMRFAEIDSSMLVQGGGYTGTAIIEKPKMPDHLDLEGPELGKDLDLPDFITSRSTAMATPAAQKVARLTSARRVDLDEGPEIGWANICGRKRSY